MVVVESCVWSNKENPSGRVGVRFFVSLESTVIPSWAVTRAALNEQARWISLVGQASSGGHQVVLVRSGVRGWGMGDGGGKRAETR